MKLGAHTMATLDRSCRTVILSGAGLFAEGLRSLLPDKPVVEIVGLEQGVPQARQMIQALRPDVVVVVEPAGDASGALAAALEQSGPAIVRLSLDHTYATIHPANRQEAYSLPVTSRAELTQAICRACVAQHTSGALPCGADPAGREEVR
jgi:hypothetical protein